MQKHIHIENKRKCFFALPLVFLSDFLSSNGFEKYRAKQIFEFVYKKYTFDFDAMSVLPATLKKFMSEHFYFSSAELLSEEKSKKDAGKFLFKLNDGALIESVLLTAPTDDGDIRKTICISTQVGCAQGCKFCASTQNGFKRNLTFDEIISQLIAFTDRNTKNFVFENVVVMGMGEPLANLENVLQALKILNENFSFGARRITLSTAGLADKILHLAETDFPYRLAVSLHATSDLIRNQIMPINKKFPLKELLDALKIFSQKAKRMITLEYILIDSLNDSLESAKALAKIAKNLHAHVNLIPYNTVEGLDWKRPALAKSKAFLASLEREKISASLRYEKGSDIEAACGQLALKTAKKIARI